MYKPALADCFPLIPAIHAHQLLWSQVSASKSLARECLQKDGVPEKAPVRYSQLHKNWGEQSEQVNLAPLWNHVTVAQATPLLCIEW